MVSAAAPARMPTVRPMAPPLTAPSAASAPVVVVSPVEPPSSTAGSPVPVERRSTLISLPSAPWSLSALIARSAFSMLL